MDITLDELVNTRTCYYDRYQCKSLDDLLLRLGIEPLSDSAHEIVCIFQAQEGDVEALEHVIGCNIRLCVCLSNQYQHRGLSLLELIKLAENGMVRAIMTYKPKEETRFIKYAITMMRREIVGSRLLQMKSQEIYNRLEKRLMAADPFSDDPAEHERLTKEFISAVHEDYCILDDLTLSLYKAAIDFEVTLGGFYFDLTTQYIDLTTRVARQSGKPGNVMLGDMYRLGKEEFGIFIEPDKAKPYYDAILQDPDYDKEMKDIIEEQLYFIEHEGRKPMKAKLIINSSKEQIECIKTVLEVVSMSDESSFPVSLPELMEQLVQNSNYLGNIVNMHSTDTTLTLEMEAEENAPRALGYALQKAFPLFGEMDFKVVEE